MMADITNESEVKGNKGEIRIIMLPRYTVAACRAISESPEETVEKTVSEFIKSSNLYALKPDSRMFGFNSPNPGVLTDGIYGYEVWTTIPDDMELPEGFEKKTFEGGMYAAMTIRFPEFHKWADLVKWAENNDNLQPDWKAGPESMHGMLEEHLNWVYLVSSDSDNSELSGQIDLLLPIKSRE